MKLDEIFKYIEAIKGTDRRYSEYLENQLESLRKTVIAPLHCIDYGDRLDWCYACDDHSNAVFLDR